MKKISDHVSYREATKSITAKRKGLDNTPNEEQTENMQFIAKTIFEPLRDALGRKPIGISSFFRSAEVNVAVGGSNNSQHCFDEQTEILTDNGWKNIDTFDIYRDKIGSYNINNDKIEFLEGDECIIFNYKGPVECCKNKHINYVVDPDHRIYAHNTSKNSQYNFYKAKDCNNKRRTHKVAGIRDRGVSDLPHLNFAKLCMAVISDGSISKKKDVSNFFIRFNLKRKYKLEKIEYLLKLNEIAYNKRYCENREKQGQFGVYEYTIESHQAIHIIELIEGKDKKIPIKFLNYSSEELQELIDEYGTFDGCFDKREGNTGLTIFSTNEYNIDMLQIMSILSNRRCIKKEFLDRETNFGILDKFYNLYISNHNTSRVNEDNTYRIEYEGKLWTVNNQNTTLIVRRNGKVFITGNCKGQAVDIDGDIIGLHSNKEIFDWIYNNGSFDQMISEFPDKNGEPGWVHVSKTKQGNREETLVAFYDKNGDPAYRYYENT